MAEKLILVGNGMAGMRTVEELLKLEPEAYQITVFGAEPYGNYNRILLSPVLASEKTIEQIMLNDEPWYADNGITLRKGSTVVRSTASTARWWRTTASWPLTTACCWPPALTCSSSPSPDTSCRG